MSAATANGTTSSSPSKQTYQNSAALQKVLNVPYISDSLSYADSTIKAHPLIQQGYQLGENVVNTSLNLAQPITTRIAPQLALLDQYAVKGLDYAESKWSYPFHATSSDLYENATAPAKQVLQFVATYQQAIQQIYSERVATPAQGAYSSASKQFEDLKAQNAYVARATKVVEDLQAQLASTVEGISGRGKQEGDAAARKAQGYSNAIFAELERVRGFASQLPAEGNKRFQPVMATFSETYEKLSKEAKDSSVAPSTRFMNVLNYVREQSLPALQKAIVHPEGTSAPQVNGSK